DMLDRAVLAGCVHRLEDDQDGVAVIGIEQLLRRGQVFQALVQDLLGPFLDDVLAKSFNSLVCAHPVSWSLRRTFLPGCNRKRSRMSCWIMAPPFDPCEKSFDRPAPGQGKNAGHDQRGQPCQTQSAATQGFPSSISETSKSLILAIVNGLQTA